MKGFWWNIDDEPVEIIFSLCRNGRWMYGRKDSSQKVGVWFDYLDYEGIAIGLSELDELGQEVKDMLLQILNLETT